MTTFQEAVIERSSDEVFAILITVTHPQLASPVRICNDTLQILPIAGVRGVVSNGNEYIYFPFEFILPDLQSDSSQQPQCKITFDNTSLEIITILRQIAGFGPPSLAFQIVRSKAPDTVEIEMDGFILNQISYDAGSVTSTMTIEHFSHEPYPAVTFTPSRFPGIFVGSVNPTVKGS